MSAMFGNWEKYWRPGPLCPNCLAPGENDSPEPKRHWVSEGFIDGIEHGDWTCERAPEDELIAAGYLIRLRIAASGGPEPKAAE